MLAESEKLHIISEVLDSPEFKDSGRYRDLLLYLFRETLSGTVPKEITIGTDFFHKDSTFDPKEDPTVRVYLNNLRKKLEHYYLTTEKVYSHRIEIPRGHYQVEFVQVDRKHEPAAGRKAPRIALAVGGCIVLLSAGFFLRGFFRETPPDRVVPNPIWTEFVQPGGRPTLIVLGDFFFLFERAPKGATGNFVRNLNINSFEDFKEKVKQDPAFSARYVQSDFTFLRPSASWGLAQILPALQNSPNGISLKLASQFTVDDLKSNNIVFLGSFKTLYSLHKFLHIFGLEYSLFPNRFEIRGEQPDSVAFFLPKEIKGGEYEKDYAVVAKGAGPDGSTILLLLGFSDSGVIEAARAVTDKQMVATISDDLTGTPRPSPLHFTLVVETEGFKQAIFKSQVRYFSQHSLQPEPAFGKAADSSRPQ